MKKLTWKERERLIYRMAYMYIQTGRPIRNLARYFNVPKTTVHRYLSDYAKFVLEYSLYSKIQDRAYSNKQEVYLFGECLARYSDEVSEQE